MEGAIGMEDTSVLCGTVLYAPFSEGRKGRKMLNARNPSRGMGGWERATTDQ